MSTHPLSPSSPPHLTPLSPITTPSHSPPHPSPCVSSLIHVLLLNANGDLYQIADKFSQSSSLPTTDDNDDGIDAPFR